MESDVAPEKESLRQPVWHVVVLYILTLTAYTFYWFFKNWRDLFAYAKCQPESDLENSPLRQFVDISPLLRTICLFVPFLNIYMALTLIKGIAELNPSENAFSRKHPLIASGLVLGSVIALLWLAHLPGSLFLLSYLAVIPLIFVQAWLNNFWAANEPTDAVVRQLFTVKELIAIIVGSFILGLAVMGQFITNH